MADETIMNGELSDAKNVEITGDESSSKITGLNQRITELENENGQRIQENEGYKQQIEELKASAQELSAENQELKKQVEKAESENKVLGAVAARAADLEGEVSRLQHDLVSAMSDLQEMTIELSDLKTELDDVKESDKAKGEKLQKLESKFRNEAEVKEEETRNLKKKIEELEVVVGKSKVEISSLESILKEKDKVIGGFDVKERAIANDVSVDTLEDNKKGGLIGGLKQKDWVVVGGSTVAAIAVMGVACYIHAAKKH